MKRLALITVALSLSAGLASSDAVAQDPAAAAQANFDTFNQGLSPYGTWNSDATYGPVFYPTVQYGWRPYLYGQWVWTATGWTWVSSEPFGWATFHYGRWWWNPYTQAWGWVPGYEYAPAWVTWRYSGAAVGWAPLYVGYDTYVTGYPVYYNHWTFVPCGNFYGGPVYSYAYPATWVQGSFYTTTVVNGYVGTTVYGPPVGFVGRYSRTPIVEAPIVHAASPVGATMGNAYSGGAVTVFHPSTMPAYQGGRSNPVVMRGPGAAGVGGVRSVPNAPTLHNASNYNQHNMNARQSEASANRPAPTTTTNHPSYPQTQTHYPANTFERPTTVTNRPQATTQPARTVENERPQQQQRVQTPEPARQQPQRVNNPQPAQPVRQTVAQNEPRPSRPSAPAAGWNAYHRPAPAPTYHPQPIANRSAGASNNRRTVAPAPAKRR